MGAIPDSEDQNQFQDTYSEDIDDMDKIQFVDEIATLATEECRRRGYGDAQAWTCVCQAICESNWGRSTLMGRANAFFGIKASKAWVQKAKYGGLVFNAKTKECYDGKNYENVTASFRAYNSMADSVSDYFDLMETSRYKASLTKNTVKDCITAIKNGGYATSPTYIETIYNIFLSNKSLITYYKVGGLSSAGCFDFYPIPSYKGDSIVEAFDIAGIPSDRISRGKIARANGITGYRGSAKQNTQLLDMLRAGTLRRV